MPQDCSDDQRGQVRDRSLLFVCAGFHQELYHRHLVPLASAKERRDTILGSSYGTYKRYHPEKGIATHPDSGNLTQPPQSRPLSPKPQDQKTRNPNHIGPSIRRSAVDVSPILQQEADCLELASRAGDHHGSQT